MSDTRTLSDLRSGDTAWVLIHRLRDRSSGIAKPAVVVDVSRGSVTVDAPRELRTPYSTISGRPLGCRPGISLSVDLPEGFKVASDGMNADRKAA